MHTPHALLPGPRALDMCRVSYCPRLTLRAEPFNCQQETALARLPTSVRLLPAGDVLWCSKGSTAVDQTPSYS